MSKRKQTIVHVNQHVIKSNRKNNQTDPVLTIMNSGEKNRYAMEAIIRDDEGNEVARLVYRPDKPLGCGAHVWLVTKNAVELIGQKELDVEVCGI